MVCAWHNLRTRRPTAAGDFAQKKTTPDRSRGRREGKGLFWESSISTWLDINLPQNTSDANTSGHIFENTHTIVTTVTERAIRNGAGWSIAAESWAKVPGQSLAAG